MSVALVTGGAGFIGSHVVDALIADGHRVVVVDDLSAAGEENLNPRATLYKMDIGDPRLGEVFSKEKIEWVSHHAAQIDTRCSIADPRKDARANIAGLLNLLQNSVQHRIRGLVFASSGGAVYGDPTDLPVSETCPKGPLSPYGVGKLCSEYYLYYYYRVHGLPYSALRYANVYGPRQNPRSEAGVVAIFAGKMASNVSPTIFGDGGQVRDYVYVEDVAAANVIALRRLENAAAPSSLDERAYNIGTGIGTSVQQLFDALADLLGFGGKAIRGPERPGELQRIFLSAEKAERLLGWRPAISLSEGLKRTVHSLRDGQTRRS